MFNDALKQIKISLLLLIFFTILTGLIYPAIITGIAQTFFPWQANGSLYAYKNKLIASKLIGQSFSGNQYFWGRVSATTPYPYNAANSSGSNMGPSNPDFLAAIKQRVADLKKANPQGQPFLPVDLVTASASGLDPDISPFAAYFQVPRIANARHVSPDLITMLVMKHVKKRCLTLFGEPRVNVLELNLALDNITTDKVNGLP